MNVIGGGAAHSEDNSVVFCYLASLVFVTLYSVRQSCPFILVLMLIETFPQNHLSKFNSFRAIRDRSLFRTVQFCNLVDIPIYYDNEYCQLATAAVELEEEELEGGV